jgi:hypothetical protein
MGAEGGAQTKTRQYSSPTPFMIAGEPATLTAPVSLTCPLKRNGPPAENAVN